MRDKLVGQLRRHEGYRQYAYKCSSGKWTIGIGRMIEQGGPGIGVEEAEYLLRNDVERVEDDLKRSDHSHTFNVLDDVRKAVLMNMAFNLGVPGLMGFKRMWAALERKDYVGAAAEMLQSRWAKQVGSRSTELAQQMAQGRWQDE